jgi:hypothetical protein
MAAGKTFWQCLVEYAKGEPIEGVVIGEFGWGDRYRRPEHVVPDDKRGVVLTPEAAAGYLSYEWRNGYGAPKCHAVNVWTSKHVILVVQYDGSTALESVPRNPVDHEPTMPGG